MKIRVINLKKIIHESLNKQLYDSPAAFFLGKGVDSSTLSRIRKKGFNLIEGKYDTLVYHPLHWNVALQEDINLHDINKLPKHGLLEAGANYPYSHVIIPKSIEAKLLIRKLFSIPQGQTFKNLIEAKSSRRDFLKKGSAALAGLATGGPGKALAVATGLPKAISITSLKDTIKSPGAAGLLDWLSLELAYNTLEKVLYDKGEHHEPKELHSFDSVAQMFQKNDPSMSGAETTAIKKYLQQAATKNDVDRDELAWNVSEELSASFPLPKNARDIAIRVDDERRDIANKFFNDDEYDFSDDEYDIFNDDETDWGDDYDSYEDLKPIDQEYNDERHWLGEKRDRRQTVAIPSIRHLSKAWLDDKSSWNNEIDRILR